jgi:hypothetical protein
VVSDSKPTNSDECTVLAINILGATTVEDSSFVYRPSGPTNAGTAITVTKHSVLVSVWSGNDSVGEVWQNTPPVEVPDVVGQSQADGTSALEADGFVVAVATAYSSTVAEGNIISQVPTGGTMALSGSTVTITVSLGEAPQTEQGGGWSFWFRYEQERDRRRKRRQALEEAQEAAEQLQDEVDREIAVLLQKQERQDDRKAELERLRRLVAEYGSEKFSPRVNAAIKRVQDRQTISSLLNLDRELRRMIDEEDAALVMLLLHD